MAKSEVEIWRKLGKHPNIVRFIAATFERKDKSVNEGKAGEMIIVNELCEGGTLIDYLQRHGNKLRESQILTIMKEIVAGVKHMHSLGIAHRDLKVENVLLHNEKFKLCDFGSASTDTLDYNSATKQ